VDRFVVEGQRVQVDAHQRRVAAAEVEATVGLVAVEDARGLPEPVDVLPSSARRISSCRLGVCCSTAAGRVKLTLTSKPLTRNSSGPSCATTARPCWAGVPGGYVPSGWGKPKEATASAVAKWMVWRAAPLSSTAVCSLPSRLSWAISPPGALKSA